MQPYLTSLDKANALLDEAGHPRGADGTRFPMTIDYDPGDPEQGRNVAEFLRPQLRKIGIAAEVRAVPDFPTWAERVSNFDYDVTMDEVFNWGDPVIGVARTYLSSNIRKGVVWSNMQGYKNPKVDALLDQAASEPDTGQADGAVSRNSRRSWWRTCRSISSTWCRTTPRPTKGLAGLPLTIWGAMSPLDELHWAAPPSLSLILGLACADRQRGRVAAGGHGAELPVDPPWRRATRPRSSRVRWAGASPEVLATHPGGVRAWTCRYRSNLAATCYARCRAISDTRSISTSRCSHLILQRLPATALLMGAALLFAVRGRAAAGHRRGAAPARAW